MWDSLLQYCQNKSVDCSDFQSNRQTGCGDTWKIHIVELSRDCTLRIWYKMWWKTHLVIPLTHFMFPVSLHHLWPEVTALNGSNEELCKMPCVGKPQYNIQYAHSLHIYLVPSCPSEWFPFCTAGWIISVSSSHSPQLPRVNVKCSIRKEPCRSLRRLLSLTSSQSSWRPQRSWAIATDLAWVNECAWAFLNMCSLFVCTSSHFCQLIGYFRFSFVRTFLYELQAHP